jgi:hypothetical protein
MRSPGMGEIDLERVLEIPTEHLAFHLWYLREKGWIQRLESGQIAITAMGVDQIEQHEVRMGPERLIENRSASDPSRAAADASASSDKS